MLAGEAQGRSKWDQCRWRTLELDIEGPRELDRSTRREGGDGTGPAECVCMTRRGDERHS